MIVLSTSTRRDHQLRRSPALALEVGDHWYPQALRMARMLERLLADDMIRCTIPEGQQGEIRRTLARFWEED